MALTKEWERAIKLLEQGMGPAAVAPLIGCDPRGAGRKIKMYPELSRALDVGNARIVRMREVDRMQLSEIAEATGRSKFAVGKVVYNAGCRVGRVFKDKKPGPQPRSVGQQSVSDWNGRPEDTLENRWIQRKWA